MKIAVLFNLSASGGTVCSSVLTASKSISILNEFHPLAIQQGTFMPASPIGNLLQSGIDFSELEIVELQKQVLNDVVIPNIKKRNMNLFIRWHSYSDYLTKTISNERMKLARMVIDDLDYKSVVILRDPLSTYISNYSEEFINYGFKTFLERYTLFVEENKLNDLYRYEELMMNSDKFSSLGNKLFGDWNSNQIDPKNWKTISGTKKNVKSGIREPNIFSLVDARRLLPLNVYDEIEENRNELDLITKELGYKNKNFDEIRLRFK